MLNCPICGVPAERYTDPGAGLLWRCAQCNGASSTVSQMRKYIPRTVVNSLWNAAKNGQYPQSQRCPSCTHMLTQIPVPNASFAIDICTCCSFVWFDAGEYQSFPKAPAESGGPERQMSPELAQRMALIRVEEIRRQAREDKDSPDETWKYIPALLGVPVEFDDEGTRHVPYVTLVLLAVIAATSWLGFAGILTPEQFGLIPAQWSRLAGLTFFTCFFLHSGLLHLAGNLYYLFVFGDNVEDTLGRVKFLMLLAGSALVGGLVYVLTHPESPVACIGASGGISGVLAYYTLRFPKHRIGLLICYMKWIRLPVSFYFGFWILLQIIGVSSGGGSVAHEAHLGGVLAGIVFWWVERLVKDRQ